MDYTPIHVRADFRVDRGIVPLTYIEPEGKTRSIRKVSQTYRDTTNVNMWIFECIVKDGENDTKKRLAFSGERWYLCPQKS